MIFYKDLGICHVKLRHKNFAHTFRDINSKSKCGQKVGIWIGIVQLSHFCRICDISDLDLKPIGMNHIDTCFCRIIGHFFVYNENFSESLNLFRSKNAIIIYRSNFRVFSFPFEPGIRQFYRLMKIGFGRITTVKIEMSELE